MNDEDKTKGQNLVMGCFLVVWDSEGKDIPEIAGQLVDMRLALGSASAENVIRTAKELWAVIEKSPNAEVNRTAAGTVELALMDLGVLGTVEQRAKRAAEINENRDILARARRAYLANDISLMD